MAETSQIHVGPRRGDPVYGDGFDDWAGRESELLAGMTSSYARDIAGLRAEMTFLPWEDPERILTKDRVKLLAGIMDNGGWLPFDMEEIRDILGMKSLNNAAAPTNALIREGYVIKFEDAWGNPALRMTESGRAILEYYEDNPEVFAKVSGRQFA